MRNTVAAGKGEKLMRSVVGGQLVAARGVGGRGLVRREARLSSLSLSYRAYRYPGFAADAHTGRAVFIQYRFLDNYDSV